MLLLIGVPREKALPCVRLTSLQLCPGKGKILVKSAESPPEEVHGVLTGFLYFCLSPVDALAVEL